MTVTLTERERAVLQRMKASPRALTTRELSSDYTRKTTSATAEALRTLRHNGLVALRRDKRWEVTRDGWRWGKLTRAQDAALEAQELARAREP